MAGRGSRPGQVRASGQTQGEEVTEQQAADFDQPMPSDLDVDREKLLSELGFSRMRVEWRGDDLPVVRRAAAAVEGRIKANFGDAYRIMYDLFDKVRTPEVDPETGAVLLDQWGLTVWRKLPSGAAEEDWTRLTSAAAKDFLFRITTRLFDWEQNAANAWSEAMFAKSVWTERFAVEYDKPMSGTIEDRTAIGNQNSADERYFAVFLGSYSRRADAVVRSMDRLALRLRDYVTSG